MLGQCHRRWASIGPAMDLHSLYCPQDPFKNINYKIHQHSLAINLYGYAAGGETFTFLQETVTLLVYTLKK